MLRDHYRAFRARSPTGVEFLVLFLDAIYRPTRPSGAKEGVLVAWGYTEAGERVLLDVCLGLRERYEDWLEMGRGLTRRGLRAPRLAVVDGAPGLNKAVPEFWPDSDCPTLHGPPAQERDRQTAQAPEPPQPGP